MGTSHGFFWLLCFQILVCDPSGLLKCCLEVKAHEKAEAGGFCPYTAAEFVQWGLTVGLSIRDILGFVLTFLPLTALALFSPNLLGAREYCTP